MGVGGGEGHSVHVTTFITSSFTCMCKVIKINRVKQISKVY